MMPIYSRMFPVGSSRSIESTIQAVTICYKPLRFYLHNFFVIDRSYLMLELVELHSVSRVAFRISFFISLLQVYTLVVGSCSVEICEVFNL